MFVTGTDTAVGKTVITAALATALIGRRLRVAVMKPVESGCNRERGALMPHDAIFLRAVCGNTEPLSLVCPYPLEDSIAPALAAEKAGVVIDLLVIRAAYEQLCSRNDIVLVEGAGGILAPLFGDHVMRDMARLLGLPVLVIARNILGVINHTALTVAAARAADLTTLGIVLNNPSPDSDQSASSNPAALRRWGGAPFRGQFTWQADLDPDALGRAAEGCLDVDALLDALSPGKGFTQIAMVRHGGRS